MEVEWIFATSNGDELPTQSNCGNEARLACNVTINQREQISRFYVKMSSTKESAEELWNRLVVDEVPLEIPNQLGSQIPTEEPREAERRLEHHVK
jgi:hypothetical protein